MTQRSVWAGAGLFLAAACAGAALADEKTITGTVVGEDGQAVFGAEVAVAWSCTGHDKRLEPAQTIKTDLTGRFIGKVPCTDGKPVPIMALDPERKLGALIALAAADLGKAAMLKLAPLVFVKGEIDVSKFEAAPKKFWIDISVAGAKMLSYETDRPAINVALPLGRYELTIRVDGSQPVREVIAVERHERSLSLGKLCIEPPADRGGKSGRRPPPINITDARGVSKDMKLSDYKGKWVLIDFWAYWCGPCVGSSLPRLFQFAEEHAADKDRFVILTVHGSRASNLAELDPKLENLEKNKWRGKKFPFPIIIDNTGATQRAWGIRTIPRVALIDPAGNLVMIDNFGVDEVLSRELKKSRK